jgi:hypothetical protein
MLTEAMSPIGLFAIVLSLVLVSLIPSLVIKCLMAGFFVTTVSYGMILVSHVVSGLLIILALGLTEILSGNDIDSMSNGAVIAWTVGSFFFQLLCLNFIATGPRMIMIGLWKWGIVLALQYVVYFLIAFASAVVLH